MSRPSFALYCSLLFVATAYLWLRSFSMSLSLDETVTYWIVVAPFSQMISRAVEFQFSSLYFALIWPVFHVGLPHSEIVLRLPSLTASAVAAWIVYRTASRLFDREAGLIAAIAFTTQTTAVYAAAEARFYGIGLLAVTASMFFYLRWAQERDRIRDGLIGVGLACFAVYVHPTFGLLLLVQALGVASWLLLGRLSVRHAAILATLAAICLLPWPLVAMDLLARRESLSWVKQPSPLDLIPPVAVPALLFLAVQWAPLARLLRAATRRIGLAPPDGEGLQPAPPPTYPLIALWCVLPPLVLYGISTTTTSQVFAPRYFSAVTPAFAVLVAGAICLFLRPHARVIAASILAISACFLVTPREQRAVDWRETAATVRALSPSETTPVLFHSGLIESAEIDWLTDQRKIAYLLAPLTPYPHGGKLIPLPFSLNSRESVEHLSAVYRREISGVDRFIVTGRHPLFFRRWFKRRATAFTMRRVGRVLVFERRAPRPQEWLP